MSTHSTGIELQSLEYSPDTESYRATYGQATTSASMAVITAVADTLGVAPTELDPLYTAIDTDALDELMANRATTDTPIYVSFTFESLDITVASNRTLWITPIPDDYAAPPEGSSIPDPIDDYEVTQPGADEGSETTPAGTGGGDSE